MTYYSMVNVKTGEIYAYLVSREDLEWIIYKNKYGEFLLVRV